jgi:glycosyltransferase involved in cell wall biosynthesis
MKVLSIVLGTELLGSERGNLEALHSLRRQGCDVVVGISGRESQGGAVGDAARRMGFETFEMPSGSHFSYAWMRYDKEYRRRQLKRLWTNSKLLLKKIQEENVDVVIINGTMPYLFCWIALSWSRIPVIYRMGDSPSWQSKFQMLVWRSLVRRATAVVCISDFIRKELKQGVPRYIDKAIVIRNHPITRFETMDEELVSQLLHGKMSLQIVYVGQITPQKGVFHLVEALVALDDPRIGAWILGGSQHTTEAEKSLQSMVESSNTKTRVELMGYVNDPRTFYTAADWHIAPSIYPEALGNIVLEAKTCGTPSIVSGSGGLPELIENGKDGFIIHEVSVESLKSTISDLFSYQEQWKTMGSHAKDSIHGTLSTQTFDSAWMAVLNAASQPKVSL